MLKILKKKIIKTTGDSVVVIVVIGHQLPVLGKLSCSSCLPTVGLVLHHLFYDLRTKQNGTFSKLFQYY